MSEDWTVEAPTHQLADGRLFISDEDWFEHAWVREFVARFPNYWTRSEDIHLDGWVSPKPDDEAAA